MKKINKEMKKIFNILLFLAIVITIISAVHTVVADTGDIQLSILNQNPNPARAGDTFTLRFQVENNGKFPVQNLKFNVVEDYPFSVVDSVKTQTIVSLAPYQVGDNAANIQFTIKMDKDAHQGSYPLKLQYTDSSGIARLNTYYISTTSQNYAQIIYVDKSQLQPGQETPLNFTITNVGSAPLQNLVFTWAEPTGSILPVYSDDSRYIKYLDVGQSQTLSYTVIANVNANPGLYNLNLNLNYQSVDNASSSSVSTHAGIFVGGGTDFDVAFSESTAGQTSLSISNIGNNPAASVSVKIPQQEGYVTTGSTAAIVGNLNKGDYTIVSFQIASRGSGNFTSGASGSGSGTGAGAGSGNFGRNRNATSSSSSGASGQTGTAKNFTRPTSNDLQVVIEYTDTAGNRISVEKNVSIQFRSAGGAGASGYANGQSTAAKSSFVGSVWFWILIIIVVIGAIYTYRRYSNKKKK